MRMILLPIAILFACLPAWADTPAAPKFNLTILADDAMLLPLARIARLYASESKTPLTIVVKNANAVQQQIEQGLEAHVIITANISLIEQLAGQGLTDVSSRKAIARTQLALVTATSLDQQANVAKRISFASMLAATPTLPVYTNHAKSMEGALAAKLLDGQPFSVSLATRLETKTSHDDVMTSLREAPSLALILAAEAVGEADISVASLLSDAISPEVNYNVVVLGSELMSESKVFANYLSSRPARAVFTQFGYQPPTP